MQRAFLITGNSFDLHLGIQAAAAGSQRSAGQAAERIFLPFNSSLKKTKTRYAWTIVFFRESGRQKNSFLTHLCQCSAYVCPLRLSSFPPYSLASFIFFFAASMKRDEAFCQHTELPGYLDVRRLSCSKEGGTSTPLAERSNSCVKKRFLSSSHDPRKEQPFKRSAFCSFLGIHWKTKIALAGICRAALGCWCRRLAMLDVTQSCAAQR